MFLNLFLAEFRETVHNNCPWVLDKFYAVGEYLGNENVKRVREQDALVWARKLANQQNSSNQQ